LAIRWRQITTLNMRASQQQDKAMALNKNERHAAGP
jgi:hypothetical protein